MNLYETTIVLDSQQKAEDIQAITTKTETFINNNGGTIVKSEDWGKKRLAYEINRKQYGNYYHIQFEGPATLPDLLEREFRLEEAIVRYLTVRTEAHTIVKEEKKKGSLPAAEAPAASPESEPAKEAPVTEPPASVDEAVVTAESDSEVEKEAEASPKE
ncbi:30S ribosomal protein S6 [candidate division KSB1 bacterium]|nr:30S ribosomal protein S6 [candidate division KSB1 bacterium]